MKNGPWGNKYLYVQSSVYLCAVNEACGHTANSENNENVAI